MGMFDAESIGYDYDRAKSAGMGPTGDGTKENKGHWGSVAPTTEEERKELEEEGIELTSIPWVEKGEN